MEDLTSPVKINSNHFTFLEAINFLKENQLEVERTKDVGHSGYIYKVSGPRHNIIFMGAPSLVEYASAMLERQIEREEQYSGYGMFS